MITEVWKAFPEREGLYEISNHGRVKALKKTLSNGKTRKEKILSPVNSGRGYRVVQLTKDGKLKYFSVHRAVAIAFIGEIPYRYVVNHIDNNPSNNIVSNLQITTQSENVLHCVRQGRNRPNQPRGSLSAKAKSVAAFKYGNKVGEWGSISEAKEALNIRSNHVGRACSGKCKTVKGYSFIFTS